MFSLKSCMRTLSVLSVGMACFTSPSLFAASPVDLSKEAFVLPNVNSLTAAAISPIDVINHHIDANQVNHIRIQQKYRGYAVWGGDAVVHLPKTMSHTLMSVNNENLIPLLNRNPVVAKNGIFYADLDKDLGVTPKAFDGDHTAVTQFHQQLFANGDRFWAFSQEKVKPIVYIDDSHKAHFAYVSTFLAIKSKERPKRPTAIIDAETHTVYKRWDDIKTSSATLGKEEKVPATAMGYGGNPLLGQWLYGKDKPALTISRIVSKQLCVLKNGDVEVRKYQSLNDEKGIDVKFACAKPVESGTDYQEPENGYFEKLNDAYSPVNDAFYYGMMIKQLYQDWYGIPVLTVHGLSPMLLSMNVFYADFENAFWDSERQKMFFGAGSATYYPFVTLGIAAHEISHGFTEQHSNLAYVDQSGALNESFSDMAAAAASYYESGQKNTDWTLGWDIVKQNVGKTKDEMEAIRHFDNPIKDGTSIDNVSKYDSLNNYCGQFSEEGKQSCIVHFASGVYNKMFYMLATTPGWDTKSAFAVMIKANQDYWTSSSTYQSAACGVKKAANDLKRNLKDVEQAFTAVGISLNACD